MATPQIDRHTFITLSGPVAELRERVVPQVRPGVDGTEFLLLGRHASPFELVATRDFATASLADKAVDDYAALCAEGAVDVTDAAGRRYEAKVLDVVRAETVRGPCLIVGGLEAGNQYLLTTRWTIMRVE